eukprot:gene402-708_t
MDCQGLHDSVVDEAAGKNMAPTDDPVRLQQMQNDEAKWKLLYPNTAIPDRFHYRSVHEYAFLNEGALVDQGHVTINEEQTKKEKEQRLQRLRNDEDKWKLLYPNTAIPDRFHYRTVHEYAFLNEGALVGQGDVTINEKQTTKEEEQRLQRMRNDEDKWKLLYPNTAIPKRFHYRSRDECAFFDRGVLAEAVPGQLKRKPEDISPIPAAALPAWKVARQGEADADVSTQESSTIGDESSNAHPVNVNQNVELGFSADPTAGSSTDFQMKVPVNVNQDVELGFSADPTAGSSIDGQVKVPVNDVFQNERVVKFVPIIKKSPAELKKAGVVIMDAGGVIQQGFGADLGVAGSGDVPANDAENEVEVDAGPIVFVDEPSGPHNSTVVLDCDLNFKCYIKFFLERYPEIMRKHHRDFDIDIRTHGQDISLEDEFVYPFLVVDLYMRFKPHEVFSAQALFHNSAGREQQVYNKVCDDFDILKPPGHFWWLQLMWYKKAFTEIWAPLLENDNLRYRILSPWRHREDWDQYHADAIDEFFDVLETVDFKRTFSLFRDFHVRQFLNLDKMIREYPLEHQEDRPICLRSILLMLCLRLNRSFDFSTYPKLLDPVKQIHEKPMFLKKKLLAGNMVPGICQLNGPRHGGKTTSNKLPLEIDMQIDRNFASVRGGILADQIGYGKTACMIALIAQSCARDKIKNTFSRSEESYQKEYIFTNATLIVTPANLFKQWSDEFKKFVDKSKLDLKILAIATHTNMKKYKMKDFVEADVVLVSFRFFFSMAYCKYFDSEVYEDVAIIDEEATKKNKEILQTMKKDEAKWKRLHPNTAIPNRFHYRSQRKYANFNRGVLVDTSELPTKSKEYLDSDYVKLRQDPHYFSERIIKCRRRTARMLRKNKNEFLGKKALIEAFYWKRVVFDEFHEVVKTIARREDFQSMLSFYGLRHLEGRYRWGLTATPLLGSTEDVSKMASLLHIFLPNHDRVQAQRFLDEFVRANKWDVTTIPMEEKMITVSHTAVEKSLYLHHKQRNRGEEGLLKFCSHFSPDGSSLSADSALEKVLAESNAEKNRIQKQLDNAKRILSNLQQKKAIQATFVSFAVAHGSAVARKVFVHSPGKELVKVVGSWKKGHACTADGFMKLHTLAAGLNHELPCPQCDEFKRKGGLLKDDYLAELLAPQQQLVAATETRLGRVSSSLRYLNNVIKSLCEAKDDDTPTECSVCMEDMPPDNTVLTQCGHPFCQECIADALAVNPRCPQCRTPMTLNQCTMVCTMKEFIESRPKQALAAMTDEQKKREERRSKAGSKILAIVELIEKLRVDKPGEKVIIFIQWDQIRDSLISAIEGITGFKPLVLRGDINKRNNTISKFQHGSQPEDHVLVLSMEESATGMNLVCANHCILAHPMYGDTKYATDCEKQAIGRIRRQGQTKTCYLYRFFTEGTIEEELMKKHSQELQNPAPAAAGQ